MAKKNTVNESVQYDIYVYNIYGNMAAVIHIFSSHMDFFNLLKTNNWVCYWISMKICLIAKEHRRRGCVPTSMDFNNRAYFYWQSITNLMNNIEYRERFWIWLLEPIACNKNLTLGYKKKHNCCSRGYLHAIAHHKYVCT